MKNIHGDITGTIDSNGAVQQNNSYDAFGNRLNPNSDPFGYCGEYMDSESGLIYLRNRYYDTATGTFITEDPIRDGMNWYAYCNGNPIMLVDPLGLAEGTINISSFAQWYIQYYDNLAFEANSNTIKNKYVALKNDIIKADKNNLIEGSDLDVPLYSQGSTYMCYAYAEIMVSQTGMKYKYSQEWANIIADAWGKWKYRNFENPLQYKDGGSPNVSTQLSSENEIIEALKQYPIYAFGNGHVMVITGYAKAPGHDAIFILNNSEGPNTHIFTYEELNNIGYTTFKAPGLIRIDQIAMSGDYNLADITKLPFTGKGTLQVKFDGQIIAEYPMQ